MPRPSASVVDMQVVARAGRITPVLHGKPPAMSAWANPASVSEAVGWPAAAACSVRPVNPAAPWSAQASASAPGDTPNTIALSPGWKLDTVLQVSDAAPRLRGSHI